MLLLISVPEKHDTEIERHNTENEQDPDIGNKRREEIQDPGYSGWNQSIGYLRLDVCDVIGSGEYGRHDCSIGYRTAVIAEDSAGEYGADDDVDELDTADLIGKGYSYRSKNGHGTPGRSG